MSVVLPRLDRLSAQRLVDHYRHKPLTEVSSHMPDSTVVATYAAVGDARVDDATLQGLRNELVNLAVTHGMPGSIQDVSTFEGLAAQAVRRELQMTPHEASQEDVWSYLTCCWLMDVAIWRFGAGASENRFIGHVNRNVFRRLWWREEVLGDAVDLTLLGEDELVNIMERPTLYEDVRVAQAVAREFLVRVDRENVSDRMRLMREATKRLLRLTPFLAFNALVDAQVDLVVADAFDAALAGLAGQPAAMPQRTSDSRADASPEVEGVPVLETVEAAALQVPRSGRRVVEFEEVARAAIEIARRTGRVTNIDLRGAVPISSDEAREVFQSLMERHELVRRGTKRGTYYVIPEVESRGADGLPPQNGPQDDGPAQDQPTETALRRLLRRTREP